MEKPRFIGLGGTSFVYRLTPQIAVKLLGSERGREEWQRELRA